MLDRYLAASEILYFNKSTPQEKNIRYRYAKLNNRIVVHTGG